VQLSVKYETVLNMTTAKALGLDVPIIDPAERGRVDRIGISQRKKTGSPTAAMGQTRHSAMSVQCPTCPKADGVGRFSLAAAPARVLGNSPP
jgi:hypothetical protein